MPKKTTNHHEDLAKAYLAGLEADRKGGYPVKEERRTHRVKEERASHSGWVKEGRHGPELVKGPPETSESSSEEEGEPAIPHLPRGWRDRIWAWKKDEDERPAKADRDTWNEGDEPVRSGSGKAYYVVTEAIVKGTNIPGIYTVPAIAVLLDTLKVEKGAGKDVSGWDLLWKGQVVGFSSMKRAEAFWRNKHPRTKQVIYRFG